METAFRGVEGLVGRGRLFEGPGALAKGFSGLADFWRFTATGFDLAFSMTIGLPMLARSPARWVDMTRYQISAAYNPNWLAGAMRRDPVLRRKISEIVDMGLGTGDHEVYRLLDNTGRLHMNSYLDYLERPVDAGRLDLWKKGVGGFVGAFQRSYNAGSLMNRVHWYDILKPKYADEAGNLSAQARMSLKHEISNMTGAFNTTDVGKSVGSKTIENFWVGLSPRLTRATASVFADAMRGAAHIIWSRDLNGLGYAVTGGTDRFRSPLQRALADAARVKRQLTPDEITKYAETTKALGAVHNLGKILSSAMLTFYIANYTYLRNKGLSHEQATQQSLDGINPMEGKKFLSIKIGNEWYGIGGFWRSLASMHTKLIHSMWSATQGDMEPASQWMSADQFNNPGLHVLRSRGAPGMNAFGSVTERFFNVDAMPYDVIDNNVDLARHVGESFMPFAVQGVLEGESAAVAAAGFLGARSSMASLSDVTVDEARKRFNVEATSARDLSESWLKNDLLYRYVFQNHGLEARDSNSAWGLYYREKEALDVAFNKEMLTQ